MVSKIVSQIQFEIGQIDRLLGSYADLLELVQVESPGLIEITASASVLHSFYNGIENIFLTIAKRIDRDTPTGNRWHRDLLTRMTKSASNRKAVVSVETRERLADYLAFRHFYRHSYSYSLEWTELEGLVISLTGVWQQTKVELEEFLDSLRTTTPEKPSSGGE